MVLLTTTPSCSFQRNRLRASLQSRCFQISSSCSRIVFIASSYHGSQASFSSWPRSHGLLDDDRDAVSILPPITKTQGSNHDDDQYSPTKGIIHVNLQSIGASPCSTNFMLAVVKIRLPKNGVFLLKTPNGLG